MAYFPVLLMSASTGGVISFPCTPFMVWPFIIVKWAAFFRLSHTQRFLEMRSDPVEVMHEYS